VKYLIGLALGFLLSMNIYQSYVIKDLRDQLFFAGQDLQTARQNLLACRGEFFKEN
jgi:hypothetical protein